MQLPLETTLGLVHANVPTSLVSPGAWNGIAMALRRLPPMGASAYYLECRLGAGASPVDFLAAITAAQGREALQVATPLLQEPDARERATWRRLQALVDAWVSPGTPLSARVPGLWLEFDSPSLTAGQRLPSVLLCVDPALAAGAPVPPSKVGYRAADCMPALDAAAASLLGEPLPEATRACLHRCLDAIPPGGSLAHVGFMVARNPAALKLFLALPRQDVPRYLEVIGWPGAREEAEILLSTFGSLPEPFRLDLSLAPEVLPCLGLEFASRNGPEPHRRALVDLCVEHGLCTPEKRQALLTWPGSTRVSIPGFAWPIRLTQWMDLKVVHRSGCPPEAKAYLGFMPHFSLF